MAAAIGAGLLAVPTLEEIVAFLLGSGGASVLARTGLGVVGGIAVSDLINAFKSNPSTKITSRGASLRFAVVDLHNDTIVKPLSRAATYKLLTRRRRRFSPRRSRVVVAPAGAEVVTVR